MSCVDLAEVAAHLCVEADLANYAVEPKFCTDLISTPLKWPKKYRHLSGPPQKSTVQTSTIRGAFHNTFILPPPPETCFAITKKHLLPAPKEGFSSRFLEGASVANTDLTKKAIFREDFEDIQKYYKIQ